MQHLICAYDSGMWSLVYVCPATVIFLIIFPFPYVCWHICLSTYFDLLKRINSPGSLGTLQLCIFSFLIYVSNSQINATVTCDSVNYVSVFLFAGIKSYFQAFFSTVYQSLANMLPLLHLNPHFPALSHFCKSTNAFCCVLLQQSPSNPGHAGADLDWKGKLGHFVKQTSNCSALLHAVVGSS